MKKSINKLAAVLMLSGLGLAGGASFAAEFEILDRFSVDGYTMLHTSAAINGTGVTGDSPVFTVASSTFNILANGNVGIGTTVPGARLDVQGGDNQAYNLTVGTSAAYSMVVSTGGNVGIGTTNPVASLEVAGGVKIGVVTACALATAGTLRWYDGHISVCNGTAWRQLDNQAPPTITTINPDNGPVSGGTPITITGTGFVQGPEILIGGVTVTAITVVSVTQITAVTPASGTSGSKVVKITNPDGQYITGAFIYNPLPTISLVSPNNGRFTGGNAVTITGTSFVSGTTVKIDNVAATDMAFISAAELHVTAPAGSSTGAKDVKVTNPDGGFILLPGGFTYNALPTITGVSPASGPQTTILTITGTGFAFNAVVTIAGATGITIARDTSEQIRVLTHASAASGAKNVTVTNPDSGTVTLTGGFTYMVYATGGTPPEGTVSGSYRVHKFTGNGTFTVVTGGNVEYLVVAGGGGGGGTAGYSGGGGGGGFKTGTLTATAGDKPVTVGAGGAVGANGSDSVFDAVTSAGGGHGGFSAAGADGGSGGGGGHSSNPGGSGISGQGYRGGTGYNSTSASAGGGGGAGGVGADGVVDSNGASGGVGVQSSISGTTVYYSGGGGGGVEQSSYSGGFGGSGGGGAGGNHYSQIGGGNGTTNTGGGGGGGYGTATGAGGSGIVVIRYLK